MLYWWSKYVLLGPLMRLLARPTIEGLEHIPARGGAILAGNHLAVADSFLVPLLVRRRITYLAKREYFIQPGFIGWIKKVFFTGVGQVPVDRAVPGRTTIGITTMNRPDFCAKLLAQLGEETAATA